MKYYIIAGEASGDLHAANLMKSVKAGDPDARFRVWGGDRMEAQGGTVVKHYRDLAFMGFVEVLRNLPAILGNIRFCKKDILDYQPDVVVLVDYPGFNLRIAKFAKEKGFKVVYYISPQVWAWKKSRVKTIKKFVDRMIVILPFEKDFYAGYGMEVDFVGHPLLDALENEVVEGKAEFLRKNNLTNDPIIALLPGSRKMEVEKMLKVMLQVVPHFFGYQFLIGGVSTVPRELYEKLVGKLPVKLLVGQSRDLLYHADAALVTSGTATLETALIGVPEVVCYKGNRISFEIARRIVDVKYISLVNLVMDRAVVTELIQQALTEKNLGVELDRLLHDEDHRERILSDYAELRLKLGEKGASEMAARIILSEVGL